MPGSRSLPSPPEAAATVPRAAVRGGATRVSTRREYFPAGSIAASLPRTVAARATPPQSDVRDAAICAAASRCGACGRAGGFTLIEVMVVVVILGVLAAVVVPRVMDRPDQARVVKARQDLRLLETALGLYKLDNFRYPSTDQGLEALARKPVTPPLPAHWKAGGYVDRVPTDPWGRAYLYLSPGAHGDVDLWSLGADGQPGGEGVNADIGNWALE